MALLNKSICTFDVAELCFYFGNFIQKQNQQSWMEKIQQSLYLYHLGKSKIIYNNDYLWCLENFNNKHTVYQI